MNRQNSWKDGSSEKRLTVESMDRKKMDRWTVGQLERLTVENMSSQTDGQMERWKGGS